MKSFFRTLGILFVLSFQWIIAQPRITMVPGPEFSFGKVYKGTKAIHVLAIKNVGTDTLIISDVSAQCGCTATILSKSNLGPSESSNLSISFATAGYEGHVTKHVYIDSNDPETSELEIEFTADVVQSLRPDPPGITFNVSNADSTYTGELTLTNTTSELIKILSVTTSLEGLNVQLFKNELMPGEQTELQATFHPVKAGMFRSTIELKTNHSAQPKIQIDVFEIYRTR